MSDHISVRLIRNLNRIIRLWSDRVASEVGGAKEINAPILKNSMSEFLEQLSVMLAADDRSTREKEKDKLIRTQLSKAHGKVRAASPGYLIQEVIFEYHILRQVIFQVLEEDHMPLSSSDRDTIIDGIESAVNDAATMFADTLREIRERLVITLTHDLRTPLTAAKTAAELALKRSDDPELCAKSALMISANMKRLDRMIVDILTASRLQAGESIPLEMSEVNLGEIACAVIAELSLTHPDRLRYSQDAVTHSYGNADGLKRLLENIVGNALKYGDPDGVVSVTISNSDKESVIVVHNSGNPIPKDQLTTLFEPFRRTKTAGTAMGWGLGLMLVKGIVDAHQGTLRIESSKESGTDFIVILPKKITPAIAA